MYVWICVLITTLKINEYTACVNRPRYTHVYTCRQIRTHVHTYTHTQNTAKAKYILLLQYLQLAFVLTYTISLLICI